MVQSTAVSQRTTPFAPVFPEGHIVWRQATLEATVLEVEALTVFEMLPVYQGEVVVNLWLQTDDLDAGIAALDGQVDGPVRRDDAFALRAETRDAAVGAGAALDHQVAIVIGYRDGPAEEVAVEGGRSLGITGR